jgi:hypothetical protein
VDPGELRFEAITSKISWGASLRDLVRPEFGGGFEDSSGRGPCVVATNASGEQRVVAAGKRMQDMRDKATTMARDLQTLGSAASCERYDVPLWFVTG